MGDPLKKSKKPPQKRPFVVFDDAELKKKTYLTEEEASALSRKAVQTLRNDRHMRRGFPYLKMGRKILYRTTDIISGIEAGRIDPNA